MPAGQQLVNLLASNGAIKLTGHSQPMFDVDFDLLRAAFKPEQDGLTAALLAAVSAPGLGPAPQPQRRDTGNITLTPPQGSPQTIPVIILLGANGTKDGAAGLPADGVDVSLDERNKNAYILIAAGGNGDSSLGTDRSDGAAAIAIGNNENLIVALGGIGGNGTPRASGHGAGSGGGATAQGIGAGNDLYAEAGSGGSGASGTPGAAGRVGRAGPAPIGFPATPGGNGGIGGRGGDGRKATIGGGQRSFALAIGGSGGMGGPSGTAGPAAPATGLGEIAAPAGMATGDRRGGDGGDIKITLGPGSVQSPKCAAGGPGAAGGPLATKGKPGVVEP